jgi:hypothetical protein
MPWLFFFSRASSVEESAFCPAFPDFLQMTTLAHAMAFLIQQRVLCGSACISPCISADLTGDLLVVAFPRQVAFRHCVTLLVMAL